LHGGWRFKKAGGIRLKNENASVKVEESKPRQQKKKGKIAQVYKLHQKGVSVKDIAEKMKLSETIVRSYIWRAKNPQKYRALLARYFERKRQKKETQEIKDAVKSQNSK
jgi:2-C-methyl-D-erythritol 4-phosphate cytidylyltransferase